MQRRASSWYGATMACVGHTSMQAVQLPQCAAAGGVGGKARSTKISPRKNVEPPSRCRASVCLPRHPRPLRAASSTSSTGARVFTDSAPVLEVELAARSGIGWRGKHTLALAREGGSMFFLGEIFVDVPLPVTAAASAHCGSCEACLDVCPTRAIVAPYQLDARRCISYLTIEHDGAIAAELRPLLGNRIFGCDDCQLVCPWNKYAATSTLPDFDPRVPLDGATLLQLWAWDEAEFLRRTEGSAIRRIGHARWQRNLAVALGNALRAAPDAAIEQALRERLASAGELLAEHIDWALRQLRTAQPAPPATAAG